MDLTWLNLLYTTLKHIIHNTDKARPYIMTLYRLSKLAGKYKLDLTSHEIEKCKKDTLVFDGDNCVGNALDFLLKFREEERKVNNKTVEYNLQTQAQNGSGFDTWIILSNLPCDKHTVDNFKKRESIFSLRVFDGYIQNRKKQIPQYLFFRCGMTDLKYSLKKIGKTFKLQRDLLKTEMNHDEINADIWRDEKDEWVDYVKKDVLCTAFSCAKQSKAMEEFTGFSMKDCLSLPGLVWK